MRKNHEKTKQIFFIIFWVGFGLENSNETFLVICKQCVCKIVSHLLSYLYLLNVIMTSIQTLDLGSGFQIYILLLVMKNGFKNDFQFVNS